MRKRKSGWGRRALMFVLAAVLWTAGGAFYAAASAKGIGEYSVSVDGYLALRNAKEYDASNEIGKLYTGDRVIHLETGDDSEEYWYVYSYTEQKAGYVNCDYLTYEGMLENGPYCDVSVTEGYLAIRSEKSYDASNEIGKLYAGDTVLVLNDSDPEYWLIYSLDKQKAGYVNNEYLVAEGEASGSVYTDDQVGGISSGLRCDMDQMVFSTDSISFDIPDSWGQGITYNYYEDRIEFYCTAVYTASGPEDGFLCDVCRSAAPWEPGVPGVEYLGGAGGYYYYFRTPTDLRANPADTENYELYQEMFSDVSEVESSIALIG